MNFLSSVIVLNISSAKAPSVENGETTGGKKKKSVGDVFLLPSLSVLFFTSPQPPAQRKMKKAWKRVESI